MAIYKVEIFKQWLGETWANVYHVSAATLEVAADAINRLAAMERQFHLDEVLFLYGRATDLVAGTDAYFTRPINDVGLRGVATDPLPPFVTLRVDIGTVGGGRPSRKYYRGVLQEGDTNRTTLLGSLGNIAQQAIDSAKSDLSGLGIELVDVDGQVWADPSTYGRPQMRQLHRRRKKPATP